MISQEQSEQMVIVISESLSGPQVKNTTTEVKNILVSNLIKTCTLDFSVCTFIDSAGIGALVSLAQEFHLRDTQMILRNLKGNILDLFIDTGLDRFFSIEKSGDINKASDNLFETSVDIRLNLQKEIINSICILKMSGVMNHPVGSHFFKQQLLLSLTDCKKILLDMEELTFFDSLSINAVLSMNNLLKSTGGALQICGANYIVQDLLKSLCIDAIIPVFDTRKEALYAWGIADV